jgi:hypothetical protein
VLSDLREAAMNSWLSGIDPGILSAGAIALVGLEHFPAKWIRFAIENVWKPKKRADSVTTEAALVAHVAFSA